MIVIFCFEAGALIFSLSGSHDTFFSHEALISARLQGQRAAYSRFLDNQYNGLTWSSPKKVVHRYS